VVVKFVSINDLFSLNDIAAAYVEREAPLAGVILDQREINDYYRLQYASALDSFFETTWYTSHGPARLQATPSLLDFVSQCIEKMKSPAKDKSIPSLEARLVWQFAIMPRTVSPTFVTAIDSAVQELLPRIDVAEHLLTGQFLAADRVPPASLLAPSLVGFPDLTIPCTNPDPIQIAQLKDQEFNFWHQLGRFVSVRDDDSSNASAVQSVYTTLQTLRTLLSRKESRDVLYSIAVLRHIGGRLPNYHPRRPLSVSTNDPSDFPGQVSVAQFFLEREERTASTWVAMRVAGMALRGVLLQKQ
jgi:hypothetical protein